jgi:alkylation response protein AidB-like acyl-CoA dehydrogenase
MNFDLTEDQRKLQATVADFAQSEVAPVAEALDRDGVFPTELFKKAGELGITAIPFSEDLGGMGLGVLDMVIALEQLARADQSLAVSVMVSVASGLTLGRFGDAELARKYWPTSSPVGKFAASPAPSRMPARTPAHSPRGRASAATAGGSMARRLSSPMAGPTSVRF